MANPQSGQELSLLQPIATSKSSAQSTQPSDKIVEKDFRDIVGMLVQQMNRMENSIASMKQSQTKQKTGTPSIGETTTIEQDNISLHAPVDKALCGEANQPSVEEKNPCDPELNGNLESLGSSAVVKSTGNRSLATARFKGQQTTAVKAV